MEGTSDEPLTPPPAVPAVVVATPADHTTTDEQNKSVGSSSSGRHPTLQLPNGADSDDDGVLVGEVDDLRPGSNHPRCGSASARPGSSSFANRTAAFRMLEYGVSSDQGTRKTMEDQHKAMLASDLVTPKDPDAPKLAFGIPFFGVYDGHGGTQCAEFLRENLHTLILGHPNVREDPQLAIRDGVAEAERLFLQKCREDRIESGSTVAVALIVDETLITGNVGDSEIVLCRSGQQAVVLTVKHNLGCNPSEVERVKAVGGRIFHNRVGHPKFNPMLVSLAVSRAVGDAGFKLEEYTDGKASGLVADAETNAVRLNDGDEFIIIGCDGLWDVMSYQAAVDFCAELFRTGCNTQEITDKLCQQALALGSTDNVTALFVNLRARPKSSAGPPAEGRVRPASAATTTRTPHIRPAEPVVTEDEEAA